MPEIMETKADDTGRLAQPMPVRPQPGKRDWIAAALDPSAMRPHRDIRENIFAMMPAERPENFADRWGDRNGDRLATFAVLANLPPPPIDLRQAKQAFALRQAGRHGEGEEGRVVVPRRGLQTLAFVAHQLARMFLPHRQPELAPFRLMHARAQSGEQRLELHDRQVDGSGRDQLVCARAMAAPPCDQRAHVIVADGGDRLVLTEKFDQERKPFPGVAAGRVVLRFRPEPTCDVVESQRGARGLGLRNGLLRLRALDRFYFFGFAPGRGFGAAVKAMILDTEFEVPVGERGWR